MLLFVSVCGQAIAGKKLFSSARLVESLHAPADLASSRNREKGHMGQLPQANELVAIVN